MVCLNRKDLIDAIKQMKWWWLVLFAFVFLYLFWYGESLLGCEERKLVATVAAIVTANSCMIIFYLRNINTFVACLTQKNPKKKET